jgi:NTE family protein
VEDSYHELATLMANPESLQRLKNITGNRAAFRSRPDSTTSRELLRHEFGRGTSLRPSRLISAIVPSGPVSTTLVGDEVRGYTQEWPSEELLITAVRLDNGKRVAFDGSQGSDVATAVEASSAIPGFFTPVEINGVDYIDGGVHSPTNTDLLQNHRLDLIVVVAPMSVHSYRTGVQLLNGPLRLYWKRKVLAEVANLERDGHVVMLFEPSTSVSKAMGTTMMDADRIPEVLIETARSTEAMFKSDDAALYLSILS